MPVRAPLAKYVGLIKKEVGDGLGSELASTGGEVRAPDDRADRNPELAPHPVMSRQPSAIQTPRRMRILTASTWRLAFGNEAHTTVSGLGGGHAAPTPELTRR